MLVGVGVLGVIAVCVSALLSNGSPRAVTTTAVQPVHSASNPASNDVPTVKPAEPEKPIKRLTMENFERVEDGMTYDQVRCILGPATETNAESSIGAGTEFYTKTVMLTWMGSWGANCNVTFQNGRVMAKAQFGLPHGPPTPDLPAEEPKKPVASQPAPMSTPAPIAHSSTNKEAKPSEPAKPTPELEYRTWTDTRGKHLEAAFVSHKGPNITLHTREGRDVTFSIYRLSDDDREWIRQHQL